MEIVCTCRKLQRDCNYLIDEYQSDFGDEFDDWEDEDIGKADFSDDEDVSSSLQSNSKTLNAVAIYSFQVKCITFDLF